VNVGGISEDSNIKVIADERNNALVFLATASEFRMIESTLERLDIVPLQVMIEATIAEVGLTDDLEFGLQWFFGNSDLSGSFTTSPLTALSPPAAGFNFLLDSGNAKVALNALAEITEVNVISSPLLMVLDNQSARLQVGDQVPIATQSSISTTDADAPINNTIEYRDTGVILDVTPRVNASGLVVLDIVQEVSDVTETMTSGIDSPTIQQRIIESTVAVQSGATIALGGLIRDRQEESESGLPILGDIPILGNLFKTTSDNVRRTELMVLLTPRVVRNQSEAKEVTEELRRRMSTVVPLEQEIL
ncbi:MAG TPA: secretin N-terminal domain-containing protein, partial [Kiloniellaceae bacterium]|nr:secretin N-terminal domain-containing protein [Kiloniellaceae bacterium]